MILDMLMNNMMERITDTCGTVRMLAVRGLGNIAVGSPEKVQKLCLTSENTNWMKIPIDFFRQCFLATV